MTIPDHIMARAAAVAREVPLGSVWRKRLEDELASAIIAAVQEEREGCLRISSDFHHGYTDMGTEGNYRREADVCSAIAAAIRNRSHTPITEGDDNRG